MDESLLCSFFADCFALPPRWAVRTGLFEEGGGDGVQRKLSAGIRQLRIRLPACGRNLLPGGFATLRR